MHRLGLDSSIQLCLVACTKDNKRELKKKVIMLIQLGVRGVIFFIVASPLLLQYFLTRSGAKTLFAGSQKLCAWLYPFHHTWYCRSFLCPNLCESRISCTSHSGCSLIRSGGGSLKLGPWVWVSMYGNWSDMWNTLWMHQCWGIFNW